MLPNFKTSDKHQPITFPAWIREKKWVHCTLTVAETGVHEQEWIPSPHISTSTVWLISALRATQRIPACSCRLQLPEKAKPASQLPSPPLSASFFSPTAAPPPPPPASHPLYHLQPLTSYTLQVLLTLLWVFFYNYNYVFVKIFALAHDNVKSILLITDVCIAVGQIIIFPSTKSTQNSSSDRNRRQYVILAPTE